MMSSSVPPTRLRWVNHFSSKQWNKTWPVCKKHLRCGLWFLSLKQFFKTWLCNASPLWCEEAEVHYWLSSITVERAERLKELHKDCSYGGEWKRTCTIAKDCRPQPLLADRSARHLEDLNVADGLNVNARKPSCQIPLTSIKKTNLQIYLMTFRCFYLCSCTESMFFPLCCVAEMHQANHSSPWNKTEWKLQWRLETLSYILQVYLKFI